MRLSSLDPKPALPALIAGVLALAAFPAAADHPVLGERVWNKCRACHAVGPDARNKVGPQLNNLIGRPAGAIEGYRYSRAMLEAGAQGLVWDEETLDAFLARPRSYIRNTRMSFSGLGKEGERQALVAYLRHFTDAENARDQGRNQGEAGPEVPPEVLAMEGDAAYGQYLSGTCVACHQASGADEGIPSITGWPTDVFITVMFAYRSKFRENPVMQQIAGSLNNEEIAALAAYFEQQQ